MRCPDCGSANREAAKFCDSCGEPLGQHSGSQSIGTGGGEVDARGIYQAGRDIHVSPAPEANVDGLPPPTYETKWSWKSPLTLAALTWMSVVLSLLGLIAAYQGLTPTVDLVTGVGALGSPPGSPPVWWLLGFVLIVAVLLAVLWLRPVAENRTQHLGPSSLLPALTGWGGRIGLARFKGRCACGGRLRFYKKPVRWVENLNTGKLLRVTQRRMVAECARDPEHHVWRVRSVDGPEE